MRAVVYNECMVFDLITRALGVARGPAAPATPVTSTGDPAERTRIAAAVILLEAAHADGECSDAELDHVIATLQERFALARACAEELIEVAHRKKSAANDLWQFTNQVNHTFDRAERIAVMESVWCIIHADGMLKTHEDYFAHKLANLLRLPHREMIDAKVRARAPL